MATVSQRVHCATPPRGGGFLGFPALSFPVLPYFPVFVVPLRKGPQAMDDGDLGDFYKLSAEEQKRYLTVSQQMTKFARDHAIPIAFNPPLSTFAIPHEGKIYTFALPQTLRKNGATGCVLQLQSGVFIVTAEHVLQGYEERLSQGEVLNWQVGKLPPFDPLARVAWRGNRKYNPKGKDIVFFGISEKEAKDACAGRTHILSASTGWPPPAPQVGQTVLLAGYPNELREFDNGRMKPGSFSALFGVTTSIGDGSFKCRFAYPDLLSFDKQPLPMKELHANLGGMSGGPVFGVGDMSYPLVGVITDRCGAFGDTDTIVIEAVEGIPSSFR